MSNVRRDLGGGKRTDGQPDGDSLFKLPQVFLVQYFVQLRLPHEHNLQQLMGESFEISKQTDLFKNFGSELMRLIHDERGDLAFAMTFEKQVLQSPQALGFA